MITADKLALAAVAISLLSMFFAWRSFSLSRKAYVLSKKEHDDKYQSITPYLIQAIKWKDNDEYYCSFALSYTNQATTSNPLKQVDLEIEYYDKDENFNKARLSPETRISPVGITTEYKKLEIPLNLSAKETVSGWITYKLPKYIHRNFKIDVYRISAFTPSEDVVSIQTHMLVTALKNEK